MQKSIKISFVVAIYNVGEYVEACIKSLVSQKSDDIEILLIDDGSTDQSGEICDTFMNDSRVKVFHNENGGASVARNTGIESASGEWIYFVDGDDLLADNIIDKILVLLDDKYDIIYTGHAALKNGKSKVVGPWLQGQKLLGKDDFKTFQRWMLNKYEFGDEFAVAAPWAKLYKRAFLIDNNLRFTPGVKIGQDKLFNMYVCEKAQCGIYVSEPTYFYRIIETSRSKRYSPNIEKSYENLLYKLKDYIDGLNRAELSEAYRMRKITTFMYYIVNDFCHPDNKKTYRERREKFLYYLGQPLYMNMTKITDYRMMSWQEKMLLMGIRKKSFLMLDLLCKMRRVLLILSR